MILFFIVSQLFFAIVIACFLAANNSCAYSSSPTFDSCLFSSLNSCSSASKICISFSIFKRRFGDNGVMVASHSSTETIVVPSRTEVVRAVVLEAALWGGTALAALVALVALAVVLLNSNWATNAHNSSCFDLVRKEGMSRVDTRDLFLLCVFNPPTRRRRILAVSSQQVNCGRAISKRGGKESLPC